MSTRKLGLSFGAALFIVGGGANFWRASYVAVPAWRRSIARGAIAVGVFLLLVTFRRDRSG
jgi:hypothetical protein